MINVALRVAYLLVPLVDVSSRQNDFGFWIRSDQFLGEKGRRHVSDGLERVS